ncbi:unnamed protein product [Gulo gulo]|uniref:Uncharacterized protein n=1 Tax=Gulo gulo TaxID=48420 RepID=A0A9X9LZ95_GULGU|nr:unnamed protein product [Gulo gulo]
MASESVMQLITGCQHSEKAAGMLGAMSLMCQGEKLHNPTPEAKELPLHGNKLELKSMKKRRRPCSTS